MDATRSDVLSVLSSLEGHFSVLELELQEINRDLQHCQECAAKYGEVFRAPFEHLRALKKRKKDTMREIIRNLEGFNATMADGKKLVKSLERENGSIHMGSSVARSSAGTF